MEVRSGYRIQSKQMSVLRPEILDLLPTYRLQMQTNYLRGHSLCMGQGMLQTPSIC